MGKHNTTQMEQQSMETFQVSLYALEKEAQGTTIIPKHTKKRRKERHTMVQVTQTDDEVKIIIELNRLITRKPDIVLLPFYLKFNNPPIFFERYLTHEIDEMASFCRIFKSEARIVLIKKQKGIWEEVFQKLSKEELFKKRLEISEQIVERNKERDQQAIERYEQKRRSEIDKEVRRETAMRERVKQFEERACREALAVEVQRKETHVKTGGAAGRCGSSSSAGRLGTPAAASPRPPPSRPPVATMRSAGKINVCFSNFALSVPKRESQEGVARPFTMQDKSQMPMSSQDVGQKQQPPPLNTLEE